MWCCRLQVPCSMEPSRALSFVKVFISLGEIVDLSWWQPGYVPASPSATEPVLSPNVCLGSVLNTGWGDICHIGWELMSLSSQHHGHNMEQPKCDASMRKAELDHSKSIAENAFPAGISSNSLSEVSVEVLPRGPPHPILLLFFLLFPSHPSLALGLRGKV